MGDQLLTYLPASVPGKAEDDGPGARVSTTLVRELDGVTGAWLWSSRDLSAAVPGEYTRINR